MSTENIEKPPLTRREWYQRGYADAEEKYIEIINKMADEIVYERTNWQLKTHEERKKKVMKEFGYEE